MNSNIITTDKNNRIQLPETHRPDDVLDFFGLEH